MRWANFDLLFSRGSVKRPSSAILRGELLRFYLGLKNATTPRELLIEPYF
jgi:hypothetical protein